MSKIALCLLTMTIFAFGLGTSAWAKVPMPEVTTLAGNVLGTEISGEVVSGDKGELTKILESQNPGYFWYNPLKHAIRTAVASGVSVETVILLLLLPIIASIIAAARHLIGVRGFGIFLPAALSVVFLATGPVVGIGLFLVIVTISTLFRLVIRKLKLRFQYLPRMALTLWFVVLGVLGVLFTAPFIEQLSIPDVSIFPVLIMVLLAEDFTKVQLGKSIRVAITLTTETFVLALVSFAVLSLSAVQHWILLNPEFALLLPLVFDIFLAQYVGLRLIELWRFRKLIAK
ncbi:MAG: hypothetical protein HYU80_04715 [Candidatus Blackburnbacteria bacterium]|nr:hypothetical protein [Candidatus Blackburnbacteria bacterium]